MEWLQCLRYRWVVRTCTGFDVVFICTWYTFPFPACLPSAFVSRAAPSSDLSPSPIKPRCYPLLVTATSQTEVWEGEQMRETEELRKSCSNRPPLLMSNCLKFCKIHKRQWWLKVISVRNNSLSVCSVCVQVSRLVVLLTFDALDFPSVTPFKLTRASVSSALP